MEQFESRKPLERRKKRVIQMNKNGIRIMSDRVPRYKLKPSRDE